MPQFDSGAAKQIGRFSEGLLLRLLHGNVIAVVAQWRGIEWHNPNRGRPEILDVVQFFGQAGEISDAVVGGVEKRFHMQLIDNCVTIPLQVIAIDHAARPQRATPCGS
jgi:hypothetical protein